MSPAVIEVGPTTVRASNSLDPNLVSTALEAVDDNLALLGERAVSVRELWTELMRAAVGDADVVVLVCPTWWPSTRIERVRAAVAATTVEVVGRTAVLQREARATVVEVAPELVVVTRAGARAVVIPNVDGEVAERVAAAVGLAGPVLIDAPSADRLVASITKRLRANGIEVQLADEGVVGRSAGWQPPPEVGVPGRRLNRAPRRAVLTVVVAVTVTVCGVLGLRGGAAAPPTSSATLLVDGRVRVTVPAAWPVQRVTAGPGSARAQLSSPSDDDVALHLTQSVGPPQAGLAETAAALRVALANEPSDVFVDFNASDFPAGRAGVTYRELRADHHVAWTVLVENGVRIAIGCQSAPGRDSLVRDVCDQAIRSAQVVS